MAIIEVGIGGRFDATNVVDFPVGEFRLCGWCDQLSSLHPVCGTTSLGYDHMNILGNTMGEIAAQKAGIFKPNVRRMPHVHYRAHSGA